MTNEQMMREANLIFENSPCPWVWDTLVFPTSLPFAIYAFYDPTFPDLDAFKITVEGEDWQLIYYFSHVANTFISFEGERDRFAEDILVGKLAL